MLILSSTEIKSMFVKQILGKHSLLLFNSELIKELLDNNMSSSLHLKLAYIFFTYTNRPPRLSSQASLRDSLNCALPNPGTLCKTTIAAHYQPVVS